MTSVLFSMTDPFTNFLYKKRSRKTTTEKNKTPPGFPLQLLVFILRPSIALRNKKPETASFCNFSLKTSPQNKSFFLYPSRNRSSAAMKDEMHTVKSAEPAAPCSDSRDAAELNGDRDAYAEIIVVRHGQTDWNVNYRIQGHSDVKQNEIGRQQTKAVADRLSKEGKISAIYSSDLKRAVETAEVIAAVCGMAEVIKDPDLREQNPGKLQGLSEIEAINAHPQIFEAFRHSSWDQQIQGGESKHQVYLRCTACLQNIGLKHKGERVVVVTHGTVLRSVYRRARPKDGPAPKVKNASVSILHFYGGDDWAIKCWGDHSHLNQTEEKL